MFFIGKFDFGRAVDVGAVLLRRGSVFLFLLAVVFLSPVSFAAAAAGKVDFRREILPILSDACFRCHGPDEPKREAHLRLDTLEGLYRTREGVTVVRPGKPNESALILRIGSHDSDKIMPPRNAVRQLTAAEIGTLQRWVTEGAPWAGHWAFAPIEKVTPPPVAGTVAVSPIDAFVGDRLRREQLQLSPEADPERLLRRVTLDLTGLPPTPAERAAFLADKSQDAYEKVVDRLLASPRWGERMAVEWLDVARFSDTHGYQLDRPRAMWAWRDWVIDSFNKNTPYDRFVTDQLAGDLLPSPTKLQRLATGFNRLHNQNEEGGIVEEEYRQAYIADRVATFGTAFLGLTLECARCHDHKYDPISQKDFFALSAFFQNIDEAGQISYKGFADSMPVPTLLLTTDEQDRELASLQQKTKEAEATVAKVRADSSDAFGRWLTEKGPVPNEPRGVVARFTFEKIEDGKIASALPGGESGLTIETPAIVQSARGNVAELNGENGFKFPKVGFFKRTDPFSLAIWIQPPAVVAPRSVVLHRTKAPADAGSRGYEIVLEQGRIAFGLHYLWPGASIKVLTTQAIAPTAWTHLTVTYDGSSRAAGVRIYANGDAAALEVVRDGLFKDVTYDGTEPDLAIGQRFRDNGFTGGRVDDLVLFDRALTSLEATQLAGRDDFAVAWKTNSSQLTAVQRQGLAEYFLGEAYAPAQAAARALQALHVAQNRIVMSVPEAMVMQELPTPRKAYLLQRGAYDSPGEEVTAATPVALPAFSRDLPHNRLGLARWLLDPVNPLMARVTVNRFWQTMFGQGLVETSDNFGVQGAPPSHPELLDWLANDFIGSGWNVKSAVRQIVCSATYRQTSLAASELVARDPHNRLLARGPMRRLTAEMMRDQALAASGLLVERIGGPSVKPYQPPGLWEEIAMGRPKYEQGKGEDLYRRSLYTFWKRTVPPPTMMLFDAAERNVCTVKRQSTSTPLQALALLNDVQQVEAARLIGERMLREGGSTLEARLAWVFQLVTGRAANPRELTILRRLYEEQAAAFAADPSEAERLTKMGEAPTDGSLPVAARAAGTVLAQMLLNFDETLMRR